MKDLISKFLKLKREMSSDSEYEVINTKINKFFTEVSMDFGEKFYIVFRNLIAVINEYKTNEKHFKLFNFLFVLKIFTSIDKKYNAGKALFIY